MRSARCPIARGRAILLRGAALTRALEFSSVRFAFVADANARRTRALGRALVALQLVCIDKCVRLIGGTTLARCPFEQVQLTNASEKRRRDTQASGEKKVKQIRARCARLRLRLRFRLQVSVRPACCTRARDETAVSSASVRNAGESLGQVSCGAWARAAHAAGAGTADLNGARPNELPTLSFTPSTPCFNPTRAFHLHFRVQPVSSSSSASASTPSLDQSPIALACLVYSAPNPLLRSVVCLFIRSLMSRVRWRREFSPLDSRFSCSLSRVGVLSARCFGSHVPRALPAVLQTFPFPFPLIAPNVMCISCRVASRPATRACDLDISIAQSRLVE